MNAVFPLKNLALPEKLGFKVTKVRDLNNNDDKRKCCLVF